MNDNSLPNEKELLAFIARGDEKAFGTVFDHYWLMLCDAAYKRLQDKDQAQDIVQNIFVRLWLRRETLMISNLSVYLFTAVRYGVLDYITRQRTFNEFYEPFVVMLEDTDTPDALLIARELMDLVYAYAATLPEKRKQIFLLHIKEKLSTKEIAAELGITQKTVQNQLHTALQGLQKHITPAILVLINTI